MDRYIRQLLYVLGQRYDITLMSFMFYNRETGRLSTKYRITAYTIDRKKQIYANDMFGKRQVVMALMQLEKEK